MQFAYFFIMFVLKYNNIAVETLTTDRKNDHKLICNGNLTANDCANYVKNTTKEESNQWIFPLKTVVNTTELDHKEYLPTIFPESFDVRNKFGTRCPRIKRVYNQGQCNSAWAIAIASVISDRICIISGGKNNIMVSAQHLLSCCAECCGCNGGSILKAWDWLSTNGIITGSVYKNKKSCMPYKIPPAAPRKYGSPGFGGKWSTANLAVPYCSHACEDGSIPIVTKILGYELWSKTNHLYLMEQLMTYGPLQVSMHLYNDFRYYTDGIYVHKMGKYEGEHAVKLIGWGTWKHTEYWLAMNSFGNGSWGMNGTFMVPRNGKDNTEFGYAIISPVLTENRASGIFKLNTLIVFLIIFYFC